MTLPILEKIREEVRLSNAMSWDEENCLSREDRAEIHGADNENLRLAPIIEALIQAVEMQRKALGFYGDKSSWFETDMGCAKIIHIADCQSNCGGDIARTALTETSALLEKGLSR